MFHEEYFLKVDDEEIQALDGFGRSFSTDAEQAEFMQLTGVNQS